LLKLRDNITVAEQKIFIETVVRDTFHNPIRPDYLAGAVSLDVNFIRMFTDFDLGDLERDEAYARIKSDQDCSDFLWDEYLYADLRGYIEKQVEFECKKILAYASSSSANDEAIEAVSSMAYAGLRAANKLNDVFENLLNITSEEGLLKLLGSKKVRENISHIAGLVGELRSSAGEFLAQPQTDNIVNFPSSQTKIIKE